MKTIKANDDTLRQAAQMIKDGNAMLAQGKKLSDAGKATIETWLADNRNIQLASLPIGELVNVEAICLVEIGKQTRLDQKGMAVESPELFAKWQREFPTIKYKPLV